MSLSLGVVGEIPEEEQMFERFTDRARRTVVLAQEEARKVKHNYIGTEHVLLGMMVEGDIAEVLREFDLDVDQVRAEVVKLIGEGHEEPRGHIPFTPRAKKVIELSLREALSLGHNYIGVEHLLLGLVREGDGVGAQVLVGLGVKLEDLRMEVINHLGGPSEPVTPYRTTEAVAQEITDTVSYHLMKASNALENLSKLMEHSEGEPDQPETDENDV
jgi:ATP-dependent Clp protease ATP-binding subunit ClpA